MHFHGVYFHIKLVKGRGLPTILYNIDMTKHELKIRVNTVGELINTLSGMAGLREISIEPKRADFRVLALQREDLADELYGLPDPSLGLTEEEVNGLAPAMDELLRNIAHGLDPENKRGKWRHDAPGFSEAEKLCLPAAELAIEFDDQTGAGIVAVSHLVFSDLTPPLDIEEIRKTRPQEFRQGQSTRGGIFEIEQGAIHSMIAYVGLEHSLIEAEDQTGDDGIQRRTVSLRFQRKP